MLRSTASAKEVGEPIVAVVVAAVPGGTAQYADFTNASEDGSNASETDATTPRRVRARLCTFSRQ
jgi:hypothetical protein